MQKELITQAQRYIIERGWAIIPGILKRNTDGSKKVNLKSDYWNKDIDKGLDDPALVKEVFKGKNALGVVTGFRSGITVLDLDTNKKTGELYTPLNSFPKTYTVKTQSGGYHLYYQYYSEIKNKADVGGELYKKVDCRNDGGFVFAPPTEIDGVQVYEVINDIEPQPFPVELFSDIKTSKKNTEQYKGMKAINTFKNMEQGERDTALFSFAYHAYQITPMKEWPQVDTSVWIMNSQMKSPLTDPQVTKICNSARGYHSTEEKEMELVTDKKGNPKLELQNVVIVLRNDPLFKERIRANTFTGTIEYYDKGKWEIIQKSKETALRVELASKYFFMGSMPRAHIEDAISLIAVENKISPIAEHFKSLKWDKKERLDKWLSKVYLIDNNEYYKEMGTNYLIGLVNRVIRPGCQMDNAIVLDGVEGFGKSQSLRMLCEFDNDELGTLFNETSENPDGKDFAISLLGSVITEFAEGAVFDYRDRKKVKSFMSKISDKYRPPYERSAQDFPRQGVFAMSTNDSQYLEDRGINRRWWPVVLKRTGGGSADIKWLKENKEQLYAEAMEKIDSDYWGFTKEAQEILNLLREEKKIEDETHIPIMEWYMGLDDKERDKGITKKNGWAIMDFKKDPTDFDLKKVGEFYTEVLYLVPARRKFNGITRRVFIPSENTPEPLEELIDNTF